MVSETHSRNSVGISKRNRELCQELQELKTSKRQEIASRLEHAKTLGDLSENAEYQEAKEEQSLIESQIIELEEKIREAVVIQGHRTDVVSIGSTVEIQFKDTKNTYTIIGSEEANPAKGRISNESPMGKAFLGHKIGDDVEVRTPGGVIVYKIVDIR